MKYSLGNLDSNWAICSNSGKNLSRKWAKKRFLFIMEYCFLDVDNLHFVLLIHEERVNNPGNLLPMLVLCMLPDPNKACNHVLFTFRAFLAQLIIHFSQTVYVSGDDVVDLAVWLAENLGQELNSSQTWEEVDDGGVEHDPGEQSCWSWAKWRASQDV